MSAKSSKVASNGQYFRPKSWSLDKFSGGFIVFALFDEIWTNSLLLCIVLALLCFSPGFNSFRGNDAEMASSLLFLMFASSSEVLLRQRNASNSSSFREEEEEAKLDDRFPKRLRLEFFLVVVLLHSFSLPLEEEEEEGENPRVGGHRCRRLDVAATMRWCPFCA